MDSQRATDIIADTVEVTINDIHSIVQNRTYKASNELHNAIVYILRGNGTGRIYTIPHTGKTNSKTGRAIRGSGKKYRASAPGKVPAVRFGHFRDSWEINAHVEKKGVHFRAVSSIESKEKAGGKLLGEMLENGTGKIKPRPYKQKVIDKALPKVKEIYKKPYHP